MEVIYVMFKTTKKKVIVDSTYNLDETLKDGYRVIGFYAKGSPEEQIKDYFNPIIRRTLESEGFY